MVKHAMCRDSGFNGPFYVSVPLKVANALQAELCACACAAVVVHAMCREKPLYSIIGHLYKLANKQNIHDFHTTLLEVERSVRA